MQFVFKNYCEFNEDEVPVTEFIDFLRQIYIKLDKNLFLIYVFNNVCNILVIC